MMTLEISLGLRPQEISRVSGNLLGVGDGFPNTSLALVEHGYNAPNFSSHAYPKGHEGVKEVGSGAAEKIFQWGV